MRAQTTADDILAALARGDAGQACARLRDALPGLPPQDRPALALAFLRRRRPGEALALLEPAPADPAGLAALAYAHALVGRFGPALACAEQALARPPRDLEAAQALANALTLCHRPASAYQLLAPFEAVAREDPELQFNLAALARFLGRAEEAEARYDATVRLQPDRWEAWRNRSELRRQTPERNHVAELERLAARAPSPPALVQLSYALAKEHEDLGHEDRAFDWLERGARLRRQGMRYDVGRDIASIEAIIETFGEAFCADVAPTPRPGGGPIFVLGMPRTGSTLLDRMLDAHPEVRSLGELQAFGQVLAAALRARGASGKADAIRASVQLDAAALGQAYLDQVAPLRGPEPFFIDKLPLNYLYAGLIAKALPQAHLVLAWRDPLDNCLAMYRTLFDEAYPFSYDQTELGRYFAAYRRLAAHWLRLLPGRVALVAYEDLLARPAGTLAPLLDRLGLDLDPACLAPEANPSPVMTASASQVRSPLHQDSVGRAHRRRARLTPLVAALGEAIRSGPP